MKSVEIKTQNLKSEEEKLNQMKSNLLKEKNILEQQREQVSSPTSPLSLELDLNPHFFLEASEELLQADHWRETVRETQEDVRSPPHPHPYPDDILPLPPSLL
jgi:hypothetical protein